MSGIIAQNTLDNSGLIKSPAGGGAWNFIKKLTASASGDLSFVDGTDDVVFDDTYKEYLFTFKDIHPETDSADFTFQVDTGTNTSYNQAMTTTFFWSAVKEDGTDSQLAYRGDLDQAQGTAFQQIQHDIGNDNDQSAAGTLHIFNPSSDTFVKHFYSDNHIYYKIDYSMRIFVAGYVNTTTALTRVQFKMSTGNIDAGDICLYGISS